MTTVLDSWVVLRYLEGNEPAASAIAELLAAQKPFMSWINLGEVFYILRRRAGEAEALTAVRDLSDAVTAELPTTAQILSAARIKADYPMAYADAFAAAVAIAHNSVLWTGDPELLRDGTPWAWKDLRPA